MPVGIERNAPSLDEPATMHRTAPHAGSGARITWRSPAPGGTPLLGRGSETEALDELLDRATRHGGALMVRGEPGVGKSALLEHAARRAGQRDMLVLKAVGVQSEAQMPFAGLHQLLRPILARAPEHPIAERNYLLDALGSIKADPELFRTALATLNLLSDKADESPILLLADDTHWLDAPTIVVLTFIARRLESDPIVLLMSQREGVETALDRAELPEVLLDRLDDDAAAELLDSRAPNLPPAIRERLLDEAAGNPLALVELPTARRQAGHTSFSADWTPLTNRLERSFAARARELSPSTQALLLTAALNDEESLADTLTAAAMLTGSDATLEDLAAAEQARLIHVEQQEVRFRHPLIRSALRQAASVYERHAAHAALAETLAADPDRRVWHKAACTPGPDEAIAAELEAAANRARGQVGGTEIAAAALQRAAELTPDARRRGARLLAAAELAFHSGNHEVASDLLDRAEPLNPSETDQDSIVALRELISEGTGVGTVAGLVAIAEQMIDAERDDLARRYLQTAARKCWWTTAEQPDRDLVLAAVDRLPHAQHDGQLLAIQTVADPLGRAHLLLERLDSSAPSTDNADLMYDLGMALTVIPEYDRATAFLADAAERARRHGRMGLLAQALVSLGDAALYSGDWQLAMRTTDECARITREFGQPLWTGFAQVTQAVLVGMRGDAAEANRLIEAAEGLLLPTELGPFLCFFGIARAATAMAVGKHAEAFDHIRRAFDPSEPAYNPVIGSRGLFDLVDSAVRIRQQPTAVDAMSQIERIVDENRSPFITTVASYARPMLADDDHADAAYAAALATQPANVPFLRARLMLNHGAWLRRKQQIVDSRASLRAARDAFQTMGAATWADRARQELRASGEKSRRPTPEQRSELTPQELHIVHLAAEGLTNREIGQRLFLSHRTVGSHLYRIFPKLGIQSRSELIRALAKEGGAPGSKFRREQPESE